MRSPAATPIAASRPAHESSVAPALVYLTVGANFNTPGATLTVDQKAAEPARYPLILGINRFLYDNLAAHLWRIATVIHKQAQEAFPCPLDPFSTADCLRHR